MRLTEERVAVLARQVADALLDDEHVDLEITEERFIFLIESLIMDDLCLEDRIDEEATAWLKVNRPHLQEGTDEWETAMDRLRDDLAASKGYIIR